MFDGLSPDIKNLLRGLLDQKGDHRQIETLSRLRKRTNLAESRIVNDLLRDHRLFRHMKLPDEFPLNPPNFENYLRLEKQDLDSEINSFISRLSKNKQKVQWGIESFAILNEYLASDQLVDAFAIAEHIQREIGCSFVLLTKLTYIYSRMKTGTAEKDLCATWLSSYGLSTNNLVALSLADTMSDTYGLFSVRKNILRISEKKGDRRFTVDLAKFVHAPLALTTIEFHENFQSFNQSSLIDAVFYFCIHWYNLPDNGIIKLSNEFQDEINAILLEPWSSISKPSFNFTSLYHEGNGQGDFLFYRQSLAWIERREVTNFRKLIDSYYTDQEKLKNVRSDAVEEIAQNYYGQSLTITELLTQPGSEDIDLLVFHPTKAGVLTRTIGLIRLLEKSEGSIKVSSEELMQLMSNTRDVAEIANRVYLAEMAKINESKLTQFVLNCLIARRSRKDADTFKLRRTMEAIVIHQFDSDILQFIKYLDVRSNAVADFVYELCDEAFLSQLFRLFDQTDDYYICRANLHDWYGDRHDEPLFNERAKTLRIDLRLQKIRGEIDDTRIYVDPNRYFEWLQDNLFSELSSILRSHRVVNISLLLGEIKTDLVTQQKPENRMASLISKAFAEFYTNTKFGITSYLGRRIRHGTLKGTMITPVKALIESKEFSFLFENADGSRLLKGWLKTYEQGVEELSNDYLQMHTNRNPKGLFDPDVYRSDRSPILRTAILDIDSTFAELGSFPHINAKIYSYCWRFADKDLKQVREHLLACRQVWGKLDVTTLRRSTTLDRREEAGVLLRKLSSLLDERFRTITSWFNEPKNLSPSAPLGLLFQAVMAEVKESFTEFKPKILADDNSDIVLSGGTYHLIYDALYVVVHNAAKHGKLTGELECEFKKVQISAEDVGLSVRISSETLGSKSDGQTLRDIHQAMLGDNDDALAVEGRSGFKKLMRMENDKREMTSFQVNVHNGRVIVICVFKLVY